MVLALIVQVTQQVVGRLDRCFVLFRHAEVREHAGDLLTRGTWLPVRSAVGEFIDQVVEATDVSHGRRGEPQLRGEEFSAVGRVEDDVPGAVNTLSSAASHRMESPRYTGMLRVSSRLARRSGPMASR